jgi:glucokinase
LPGPLKIPGDFSGIATIEAMTQLVSAPHQAVPGGSPEVVLALDLGGTQLRTAVVRGNGALLARRVSRTPRADAKSVVAACLEQLRLSRAEAEAAGAHAEALAISAPGPLDPRTGVLIDPPNLDPSLRNFPLAQALGEGLALPAVLERDTQVAALAEGRYGEGRGVDDYVYLTVSTGIGGAVVSGGILLRGPDGVAGELGHLTVDINGPMCGCGGRGHLEALSSGTGIAAAARTALDGGAAQRDGLLARLANERGIAAVEAVDVALAEAQGDPLAAEIMGRARDSFAAALVSIVDVFNPERVIVGGGVAAGQGERLLEPAREKLRLESFRAQAERATIVPAALGDDVGLMGALPLVSLPPLPPLKPGAMRSGRMALHTSSPSADDVIDRSKSLGATVLG